MIILQLLLEMNIQNLEQQIRQGVLPVHLRHSLLLQYSKVLSRGLLWGRFLPSFFRTTYVCDLF